MNLFLYRLSVGFALAISLIGASVAEAGEPIRWAILIGIDNYNDLTDLKSSSKDAIEFGEILQERCGFNSKNVAVVVDQPKQANEDSKLNVRFRALRARIKNFVNAAEQENVQTLVIYYSGHGCALLDSSGRRATDLLLPAIDAFESNGELNNAISRNEIQDLLAQTNIPEKILVLDCCHAAQPDQIPLAGKALRISSIKRKPSENLGKPSTSGKINSDSSFVVLAGSAFDQVAGEQVFTKHLIDGLSVLGNSASDSDRSQKIEIDELFRHVRTSMSTSGGQTPSMNVISGKPDSISLAPAVVQPDPTRRARVHLLNSDGHLLSDATVKLVFFDIDREGGTLLASCMTNEKGKATLDYRFGTTRERKGQYQISVSYPGGQYAPYTTNIKDFAKRSSPADFKISLSRRIGGVLPTPKDSIVEPPSTATPEPIHREVLASITDYIEKNRAIPDLCSFEKFFPDYHALMKKLKRSDKYRASGVAICFPSVSYWKKNDTFREKVLQILTTRGVVNLGLIAERRERSFLYMKEPSYNEVKKAAFGIIEIWNADVCGLVDHVDGYEALIDTLDKSEKYEVLPGLTVCFPSKKTWDAKPSFRKEFVRVLREAFVLTK